MWQADFEAGELEVDAATRFAQTASRVLTMIFQVGVYDNPYLDVEQSATIAGSADKVEAGIEAQRASAVLLKNDGGIEESAASDWADKTAYIPSTLQGGGQGAEPEAKISLSEEVATEYFGSVITDEVSTGADGANSFTAPDLSEVDVVLVGMSSPNNGGNGAGWNEEDGFVPISLQYRPYVADGPDVREVSLSGDTLEDGTKENRSYFGKTSNISNEGDLDAFERAVEAVEASGRDIPVIAVLKVSNATIPAEFEPAAAAVVAGFGISDEALLELALGLHEPQGRLPIDFPASMEAVEAQLEDVARDVDVYTDASGNSYSFGFGLNWSGPIE
jgi:beta-glucosidase